MAELRSGYDHAKLHNYLLVTVAARDLYAALKSLVAHLDDGAYAGESFPDGHPMHAARSAIAKAEGRDTP
jgi:hypothetical protein